MTGLCKAFGDRSTDVCPTPKCQFERFLPRSSLDGSLSCDRTANEKRAREGLRCKHWSSPIIRRVDFQVRPSAVSIMLTSPSGSGIQNGILCKAIAGGVPSQAKRMRTHDLRDRHWTPRKGERKRSGQGFERESKMEARRKIEGALA